MPLLNIMAINVTARPVFVAAFRELLSSELGKKTPGLIRLVANRAGSDISHTVLVTAPSFAALNKYLDSSSGNRDMEAFVDNIVSFEYLPGFVACQHHSDPFRDTRADQVANGCPKIMKDPVWHASLF